MEQAKLLWAAATDLPSGWPMLRHAHDFYHLFYFRSGKTSFLINDIKYEISDGDCAIVSPKQYHEMPADAHSLLDVYELKFTLSNSILECLLKDKGPILRKGLIDMEQSLAYIIHAWAVNDVSQQETAEALLSSLLLTIQYVLSDIPAQVSTYIDTSTYSSLTKKMIQYIEQTHTDVFSLDNMQKALGYNKRYLCSAFKQNTGITIVDYLNHIRIRHATICFYYHGVPVSITAQCVGFSTPLHFTRVFKQLVGITPTEFRNRYGLGNTDITERKRLDAPYLSVYEEILGVKRLPLKESLCALHELGKHSHISCFSKQEV